MNREKISFGTAGWRGIISREFTFRNVDIVSAAIAEFLIEKYPRGGIEVAVGYDSRFHSENFSKSAASVLAARGIKVSYSIRDVPTPVISHHIRNRKLKGAVNITASHNPSQYSGIKFSPFSGGPALPVMTEKIEENIRKIQAAGNIKKIPYSRALEKELITEEDFSVPYLEKIKSLIDIPLIKERITAVYDPMFGSGRHYLAPLLGDSLKQINGRRDVLFGGVPPEPAEKYLKELKKLVLQGADIGLATDCDGDRFGIIDSNGKYITADKMLGLALYHLYQKGFRGAAVRSVMTSSFMDAVGDMLGVEVIQTPVGFKYIGDIFQKRDLIIGGEESGGLTIGGHLPEKDGILACLLAAEIMAAHKKPLTGIIEDIQKETGVFESSRKNYRLSSEKVKELKEQLSLKTPSDIGGYKVKDTVTLDGYKFNFKQKNSWAGIRFSGTEPVVRLYVESFSPAEVKNITGAMEKVFNLI